jgi:hypothetical protein
MRFGRALSLAALAAVLPACNDRDRDVEQGRFVLFTEDFSGPALSPVWIQFGPGTVAFDSAEGTPAPSLSVGPPNGPTGATIRITTDASFPATASLTVSVDLLLNAFPSPLGTGFAAITVFDPASPSLQATVLYDVATFSIQFSIGIVEGPKILDPGGFHRIEFSVDGARKASWRIDGVVQQEVADFPAVDLTLSLRNESDSIFNFDSIIITSP